ncbi:MAG: hypothetical protein AAFO81_12870 [Pseudomonadota bacterium]
MPHFNIQLVAILAVAFAAGTWLGWLLRREQAERTHGVSTERKSEQMDAQAALIDRVARERDEMRERHQQAQAMIHRHKRQLQSLKEAIDELSSDKRKLLSKNGKLADATSALIQERKGLARQLKLLIQRTADERAARERESVDNGHRRRATDELQLIRGIGPALAAKLRDMGVARLTDIAELDELAIARLDKQLAFRGRIRRDEWVAQAQALLQQDDSAQA